MELVGAVQGFLWGRPDNRGPSSRCGVLPQERFDIKTILVVSVGVIGLTVVPVFVALLGVLGLG